MKPINLHFQVYLKFLTFVDNQNVKIVLLLTMNVSYTIYYLIMYVVFCTLNILWIIQKKYFFWERIIVTNIHNNVFI